jgi:hypothetical protein
MKNTKKSENICKQKGGEKKMKHHRLMIAFGTTVFALTTLSFVATTSAKEDVRFTKHNLSANPNIVASGIPTTTEVCIYCHTPHGGRTDVADGSAPLWNKALSSASYDMYSSPNFDSPANNQGTKPLGVSQACLSCHDGTVAFDALINAPGSGGYTAANFTGTTPVSLGHNLNGPYVDSNNTFGPAAEPFPNLGTDLRNDHPISMEICNGTTAHDPQFTEACTSSTPSTSGSVLKISRTGTFPGDIRDNIRAYKSSGTAGRWFVECASCHNPHEASRPGNADGPYPDNLNSRFLRLPSVDLSSATDPAILAIKNGDRNAGSLLCLSCHQK